MISSIHAIWTQKPDANQVTDMQTFYGMQPLVSFMQFPEWHDIEGLGQKHSYCIAYDRNTIVGYVVVCEYKNIEAKIFYGPLAINDFVSVFIISECTQYYKKKHFLSLSILLGIENSSSSLAFQYAIYRKHKFNTKLDKSNKATLLLKLDFGNTEELLKSFSKHHIYEIKKAKKNNLYTSILSSGADIEKFADGYCEMYTRRGIRTDKQKCINSFQKIYSWLTATRNGFFMGVYDDSNQLVGGSLIMYENNKALYSHGFSLPDQKKLPISYLALSDSISKSQNDGLAYFDFGGYNHLVTETDQVYAINKFKKGFNGQDFIYPPVMYFNLKPSGTYLVEIARKLSGR